MSVAVGAAVGDQGAPDCGVGVSVTSSDGAQAPLVSGVINKKVLILDPIEGSTFTVEDLKRAQQVIYKNTQIRGYTTQLLPRGGMMFKFSNAK